MITASDYPDRIAESRAKHIVPAIGAVWFDQTGRIETASYGALPRSRTPYWHIGSCTKAMTATLFGRLVDRGLIGFDTYLANALPDLADQMSPAFRTTTMRALLTHSAGVMRNPSDSTFRALRRSSAPIEAQRRFLVTDALRERPNLSVGYSNVGYIVLGAVIEKITMQSWETALSREVFVPLGISRFGFGPTGSENLAGHRWIDGAWSPERGDNPQAYGPAGRVHLALDGWGRFLRAHVQSTNFLSDFTRMTLHTVGEQGFAMGWAKRQWWGETVLLHTGSNTAWFAQATLWPERGTGLAIVCNAYDERVEKAVEDLTLTLIDPLFPTRP